MLDLMDSSRILVCVGSGGVGKTSVAAALGFLAAQRGKRVLVLTVDPSQRLKTTLGLKEDGAVVKVTGAELKGELSAAVINAKRTFDDFVKQAAQDEQQTNRILKNKLYIQLSTTLSGSQEFTALERLYSAHQSGLYDIIILDTPPTKHAIDFLKAPQNLAALFNDKVARWFRDPHAKKGAHFFMSLVQTGTRQVLRVLESLTGSDFMHELADFFLNIEAWQEKLGQRVGDVHRVLVSPQTHFCLVTSFDQAKLKEAEYFGREIQKGGYRLSGIIINRAYPEWLDLKKPVVGKSQLADLYRRLQGFYGKREESYRLFSDKMGRLCSVLKLPELQEDISDLRGVQTLASWLERG